MIATTNRGDSRHPTIRGDLWLQPGRQQPSHPNAFDVLAVRPRVSKWRRAQRTLAVAALASLLVAGFVSIVQATSRLLTPTTTASTPSTSDVRFTGVAELAAVDYLTWNPDERAERQASLRKHIKAGTNVDGWDGTGILQATSATATALVELAPERSAVVTRVRVASPGDKTRSLTLVVPLTTQEGDVELSGVPALVPESPAPHEYKSADPLTGNSDETFSKSTQDVAVKFLESYASGELDYVRAPHSRIDGLSGAVTLKRVVRWQVSSTEADSDRIGVATVLWDLGPGAGGLRCSYRITLRRTDDRWLLAAIDPEVNGSSS